MPESSNDPEQNHATHEEFATVMRPRDAIGPIAHMTTGADANPFYCECPKFSRYDSKKADHGRCEEHQRRSGNPTLARWTRFPDSPSNETGHKSIEHGEGNDDCDVQTRTTKQERLSDLLLRDGMLFCDYFEQLRHALFSRSPIFIGSFEIAGTFPYAFIGVANGHILR